MNLKKNDKETMLEDLNRHFLAKLLRKFQHFEEVLERLKETHSVQYIKIILDI